jgi:hypothetical protein
MYACPHAVDLTENDTRKLKAHNSSKEKEAAKPKQKVLSTP